MTFNFLCFCTSCYIAPVEISVNCKKIEDVSYVSPVPPECVDKEAEVKNWPTVLTLFGVIEKGLTESYHSLIVTYHETYGYPISIDADPDELIIDEEMYYRVTSLTLE